MSEGLALWLPGLDHAGIATQMMVEKDLAREGLTKHDLGREAFVVRAQQWKETYGQRILDQFTAMGFSSDRSRLAYTMDPGPSRAVRYTFVKLFEEGLIYRHDRLVNWDPTLETALSNDEIENKEISGHLYHIRYPLADHPGEHITIATTRPETMLGDVAVAVHPDDERYEALIGKNIALPLSDREIPIIADDYVKKDFGSGALKITPAHAPQDYLIGQRHDLTSITIFDEKAHINNNAPESFQGLSREQARKKITQELSRLDLLVSREDYRHTVPHSERSGAIIEPRLCPQWYVKMTDMARPVAQAARDGVIKFYPESWKKTWLYWLDNIQDWCISRQLWWGHRVPVWTCSDCHHTFAALEDPSQCSRCQSTKITQDGDVLDTWFSSWLWPLSPFGWPGKEDEGSDECNAAKGGSARGGYEVDDFYPSAVIITAPEIIFQWLARMCMAGVKFRGQLPFTEIFFSATVCDKQGHKFSKTLGNGIDPLDVIEEHGADVLRYTAAYIAPMAGRIKMARSDFKLGRHFLNKLWNAGRFLYRYYLPSIDDSDNGSDHSEIVSLKGQPLSIWQAGLIEDLRLTCQNIDECLSSYNTPQAVREMHAFTWNSLCDEAIEASKSALAQTPPDPTTLSVMLYVWECTLRMLHPLMPFVTEELWHHFPAHPDLSRGRALAVSTYPSQLPLPHYPIDRALWQIMQEITKDIRRLRQTTALELKEMTAQYQLQQEEMIRRISDIVNNQATVIKEVANKAEKQPEEIVKRISDLAKEAQTTLIAQLAGIEKVEFIALDKHKQDRPPALVDVRPGYEVSIPLIQDYDLAPEINRIEKEITKITGFLANTDKRLASQKFTDRASPDVVEGAKKQREQLAWQKSSLEATLSRLNLC